MSGFKNITQKVHSTFFSFFFFFFHERGGRTGEYWPDVVEVRENKETDPFRGDGPYCKIPTEN